MGKIFETFTFGKRTCMNYNPEKRGLVLLGLMQIILGRNDLYEVVKKIIKLNEFPYEVKSFPDFLYSFVMFPSHSTIGKVIHTAISSMTFTSAGTIYRENRKLHINIANSYRIITRDNFYKTICYNNIRTLKDIDSVNEKDIMEFLKQFKIEWELWKKNC